MVLAIVILIYIGVIYLEYIPLINQKNRNEIKVYTIFLIISFVLLALISLNVRLPNPSNLIKTLLKPIIKM